MDAQNATEIAVVSVIAEIDDRCMRIEVLEDEIADLSARLTDIVSNDRTMDIEWARYLYWEVPLVKVEPLRKAFGMRSNQELTALLGPAVVGMCECGGPLFATSRTDRERVAGKVDRLCEKCVAESRAAERERIDNARHGQVAEQKNLRTMPYAEYLLTDHWQRIRRNALQRADFRCQACNTPGPLDVHHRTYERRGAEYARDVIVLCRECHSVFHEHRALA